MKKLYYLLMIILIVVGCNGTSSGDSRYGRSVTDDYDLLDGEFCADVDYYNPNTGTNSTYTLNVLVEDDYLVEIYWPNGGWLDTDHFYSEHIGDGYCSFTSDLGYEYEITLNGEPCSFTDESSYYSQRQEDYEEVTCPRCGDEKDSYDDYCDDCEDEIEHTCSRCGQYDILMYSTDDYCTDCTDEIENTCSRCGGHEYYIYGGICSSCQDEEDEDW